jgi:hypothetical protein
MAGNSSFVKGCLGSVVGILVLFGGCAYLFGSSYKQVTDESAGETPIEDTSWVPSGFTAFNNKVAYKWSTSGSYSCSFGKCAQIEVVSKDGCGSLYAEVSKIDAAGNNVGYTNATTSSLAPNQKALLMFETSGEFKTFQLAKISCY